DLPLVRPYLRRMLLDETEHGLHWFATLVDHAVAELARRKASGMARPTGDVRVEATITTVMALAPVLLPRHLEHVLGDDTPGGVLRRWRESTSELLRSPLYPPSATPAPPTDGHRAGADTIVSR